MSNRYTLDLANIMGALTSLILMALITVGGYIIGVGDIFMLDYKVIVNLFALSFVTGIVSLLKNFLTDNNDKIAGIKVK